MHINDGQNVQISEHVGIKWSMDNVVVIAPVTFILYLGLSLVFTAFIEKANSTISIMPAIYNSMVEGKGNTDGFLIVLLFFVGAFIAFGNIIAYLSKKKKCKVSVEGEVYGYYSKKARSDIQDNDIYNQKVKKAHKPIYKYEYNGNVYRVKGYAINKKNMVIGDRLWLRINPDYPTEIFYPWSKAATAAVIAGVVLMIPIVLEIIVLLCQ